MDIQKIPTKQIKGTSEHDKALVNFIAQHLKVSGKNILPVVLTSTGTDKYQVIHNSLIWEAAKLAKLDFTWAIVVSPDQSQGIQIEAGKLLQINIQKASQNEIKDVLEFARKQSSALSKIDSDKVSKIIIDYRNQNPIKSLSFLTKLKCGVGSAKVPLLKQFFDFE